MGMAVVPTTRILSLGLSGSHVQPAPKILVRICSYSHYAYLHTMRNHMLPRQMLVSPSWANACKKILYSIRGATEGATGSASLPFIGRAIHSRSIPT